MQRLLIINPNTTQSMTDKIGACARAVARPGTEIVAVSPAMGPASIESHYDEALAVPGLLQEIAAGERDGVDGYVIACFGDPGLFALREAADCPVTGLAEAAVAQAASHGSCAIVTGGRAWRPMLERLLPALACGGAVKHIETVELTGAQLHADPVAAETLLRDVCKKVLQEHRVNSIIIGGAGLAGMAARLQPALPVPLIDSVAAAASHIWSAPASSGLGLPAWL